MRKYISAQETFYLQGILNDINEQDTSFLDCKQKTHDDIADDDILVFVVAPVECKRQFLEILK